MRCAARAVEDAEAECLPVIPDIVMRLSPVTTRIRELIETLSLAPHPERGYLAETEQRSPSWLAGGYRARWHRWYTAWTPIACLMP
jgi:hypothetical protein